jgi:hypothetical protein
MTGKTTKKRAIATAKTWKGRREANDSIELEVPSGNICLVRSLSIPEMLASGILSDSLLPIVDSHVLKGQGKPPRDFKKKKDAFGGTDPTPTISEVDLLSDPEALARMFDGIDKALPKILIEPELRYHKGDDGEKIPASERDEDVLYTDEVDFNDKLFIFNFMVGGTANLEQFRGVASPVLGDLQNGEAVQGNTQ